MKEAPILMNGPMVRATLRGDKTQTRRLVCPQPQQLPTDTWLWLKNADIHTMWERVPFKGTLDRYCPYGMAGDRLWVREAFRNNGDNIVYMAGGEMEVVPIEINTGMVAESEHWRASIHMPKWACRLWLEVVSVRVERLHSMRGKDFWAEGCSLPGCPEQFLNDQREYMCYARPAQEWFQGLWDSLYAKRGFGWQANPWVWVVEFKRIPTK